MTEMEYVVIVEKGRRGYGVYAPDLPGCVALGRTRAEALRRMRTALRWHLDALRASGQSIPRPMTNMARVRVA
jgi:predicted RNase H-like HicB family nuclease